VLRAAEETEISQYNIRDWLELDEGHPEFQLQPEEETAAVVFVIIFINTTNVITIFIYFLSFLHRPPLCRRS
jgi:hypothetical protein